MTPPTPEELLRLARKAWPDDAGYEHMIDVLQDEVIGDHPRALEALHAALLVLAGELDIAALLAERDRLQARLYEAEDP